MIEYDFEVIQHDSVVSPKKTDMTQQGTQD
jgi:hypothetical protein